MSVHARVLGAGAAAALASTAAFAADHREAPRISEFPPADIGDIYAFRAPAAPNRLVLVMTVNGISDPEFAGSYLFSPRVRYTFTIDTDADAIPNRRIDVTFSEPQGGAQTFRARFPQGITVDGDTTRPTVAPTGPNEPVIVTGPGILAFAGPRDDPFFFDGVGFNRFVNATGTFSGDDSFGEHNVSAIVLEFPIRLVDDGDGPLEIGGLTTRRMAGQYPADDRRLDRTGVPGVSTAFIPTDQRDDFNRGLFKDDAADFSDEIVASLEDFGTSDENIATLAEVAIPDTLKLDLEQPIGFPNGRALEDDVIDTILTLVLNGPAGDGVDSNDREFLDAFPYLAPPFQAP